MLKVNSKHTRTTSISAGIYLLKVTNRNTRTRCEICSKLTIKRPEWRHWHRSGVVIVNFERISHLVLMFLLLTLKVVAGSDWTCNWLQGCLYSQLVFLWISLNKLALRRFNLGVLKKCCSEKLWNTYKKTYVINFLFSIALGCTSERLPLYLIPGEIKTQSKH